jgi:hypothetical protein
VTGSSAEELIAAADSIVPAFFASEAPTSFAVRFKKRGKSPVNKMDVINHVADLAKDKHTVNLDKPAIAVAINILMSIGGVSIVSDYAQFHEFNMQSAFKSTHAPTADPEEATEEAATAEPSQKRPRDDDAAEDDGGEDAKVAKSDDTKR